MLGRTFSTPLPLYMRPRPFFPAEDAAAIRRRADPVDLWIVPDHRVLRVHKDDLVVLVHPVLSQPIGVQNLEVRVALRGALLRDALDRLRHGDLDKSAALRMTSAPGPRTT